MTVLWTFRHEVSLLPSKAKHLADCTAFATAQRAGQRYAMMRGQAEWSVLRPVSKGGAADREGLRQRQLSYSSGAPAIRL